MISVCLIVKNEEVLLARCLESVKGLGEIVICDTGSTDKTVEIAKKYTDKVFTDYKWNDDFAEARNNAKSKCTGDWILTIDADEVLQTPDKVKPAVKKTKWDAIAVNVIAENNTNSNTFPRLYKNKKEIYWKGAIHNHLNITDAEASDIVITYGNSPAHKLDPDRTMRILKKEAEKNPTPRIMYYLGREHTYRKQWDEAITWLSKQVVKDRWAPQKADGYYLLAKSLWYSQRGEEARNMCLQALKINANFKSAIDLMAEMSGPKNRLRWIEFAQTATNKDVLFTRAPVEQGAEYYNKLFTASADMSRYEAIQKKVGELAEGCVLDIGCGTGELAKYIVDYHGFDISTKAVEIANNDDVFVGDAYDKDNYGDFDTYIMTEVLEHIDDYRVLRNIPTGKRVIFSVPSFPDPSHIRTFTEEIMRIRYKHFIEVDEIIRFNWKDKWVEGGDNTPNYILLVTGARY